MTKTSKTKRILKIIGGVIIFFTLPSLLFFGFLYLRYDEDLPTGKQGEEAEKLAQKMTKALNISAYKNTDYIEWSFKGSHHYKWYKSEEKCHVSWDKMRVVLNFSDIDASKVFAGDIEYNGEQKHEYILKAEKYFNNDSFWLVAPYKVFDQGVERRLVVDQDGKKSLLVTYTRGGSTPGDSYLWHLDDSGKPKSFQMWVDILPIGGLEATWQDWMTTESGAKLPTNHKLLVFNLEITNISSAQ
ncbi:hypothetical protein [Winogradskyella sp. A3E31]|uniref:hypothetical protein n=1 Tax=Winogradskyella sp. A3E31 TaxID=3349637 RepID=UPI00398A9A22